MLIGLIKWSCTVQASELPVRASQLIAFDAGHAGLSFLPQSPRMICHPRVRLCGHPQTHKNMLAASSVGLRLAATRPACNLTSTSTCTALEKLRAGGATRGRKYSGRICLFNSLRNRCHHWPGGPAHAKRGVRLIATRPRGNAPIFPHEPTTWERSTIFLFSFFLPASGELGWEALAT